jgi:hypothetical protein
MKMTHLVQILAIGGLMGSLGGCAVALTALGVGAGTAFNHTISGIAYKTFTAPLPKVKSASIGALNRMRLTHTTNFSDDGNEVVKATGKDRSIEIVLEPISSNSTRMRVIARNSGLFYDSATATEIISQTERILGKT